MAALERGCIMKSRKNRRREEERGGRGEGEGRGRGKGERREEGETRERRRRVRKERRRGHHREENRKNRESRKDMSEGVSAGREGVSDAHYLCDFHRVPVTINQMRFKKRKKEKKEKKKKEEEKEVGEVVQCSERHQIFQEWSRQLISNPPLQEQTATFPPLNTAPNVPTPTVIL